MRDLFIGKAVNYAAKTGSGTIAGVWESTSLVDGAIAMVDSDGTIIASNASSITSSYVELLTKTSTTVKKSFPIYKSGFTYTKKAYTAPVAAVKYLGSDQAAEAGSYSLNLPASLSVGDKVGLIIVDLTKPHEDTRRYRQYVYTAVSGDSLTGKASSNVIVKLKALMEKDPLLPVTIALMEDGSDNVDGMEFTAKTAGNDFAISNSEGILQQADIVEYRSVNKVYDSASTTAVQNVTGNGTVDQITEAYKATASRDGNSQYMTFGDLLYSGGNQIVAGSTYTVYVLTAQVPNTDAIVKQNNPALELVIAVPSGETGAGEIVAVLDALLAKI
jgi:hypothetical protein